MPRARLLLGKPLRERIRAGHPWVYDRAVDHTALPFGSAAVPGRARSGERAPQGAPGEVIAIADAAGPIATAFFDPGSPIRARILDQDPDADVGDTWATGRAAAAAERRTRDPLLVGCTGRRLVHGEGDGMPGLVVDQYADTAVLVFDGVGAAAFWRPRLPAVLAGLARGGSELRHAWLRGQRGERRSGGEAILGDPPAEIAIAEDEARFAVDVRAGQKTGFFLDQRDNRRIVRRHAAGASVLNLFCYTGGFSLHAALGGATRVTSVDLAAPALAGLERSLVLSGLPADTHERICGDAFDVLARARQSGRRWELVIADPPSFAPSEKARGAALAAYRKLSAAALAVVAPGGRFALASCSSHVTEQDLLDQVSQLPEAGQLRLRAVGGSASDHPVLPAFPEGRYLKFLFFDLG